MQYFVILEDNNTIIKKQNFQEAKVIPHTNFILREDPPNQIHLINNNDIIIPLRIGNFEVVDMNDLHYNTRYIYIHDYSLNRNKKFWTNVGQPHFITQYLLPLLNELILLGNLEVYERIKLLELEVQNLKEKVKSLKNNLNTNE